jgi:hypothetical protein
MLPADSSYSPRSPARIGQARPTVAKVSGSLMAHGPPAPARVIRGATARAAASQRSHRAA